MTDKAKQKSSERLLVQGILIALGDKSAKIGIYAQVGLSNEEMEFLRRHLKQLIAPTPTEIYEALGFTESPDAPTKGTNT